MLAVINHMSQPIMPLQWGLRPAIMKSTHALGVH